MAASPPSSRSSRKRGGAADPAQTREALLDAAFETVLEEGFRGTTARSIAGRADCNQAAIYYHFGGIEPLLIAALERSSQRRLDRYRAAVPDTADLGAVVSALGTLYAEDRESGHLAVLTELLGGITATPELREGIQKAIEPWLEFTEERIRSSLASHAFGAAVPAAEIADAIFSLVVGVELRNKIDGDTDRADRLFRLAGLVSALAGGADSGHSTKMQKG